MYPYDRTLSENMGQETAPSLPDQQTTLRQPLTTLTPVHQQAVCISLEKKTKNDFSDPGMLNIVLQLKQLQKSMNLFILKIQKAIYFTSLTIAIIMC